MVKCKTKTPSTTSDPSRSSAQLSEIGVCAGKHVLIVDDNVDFTMLLSRFLKTLSMQSTIARDGPTALERYREGTFDAILIDIEMPVMDGLETTRRLRAMGCSVPILAISAHAMAEHVDLAKKAGCTAFHTKPISMAQLADALVSVFTSSGGPT